MHDIKMIVARYQEDLSWFELMPKQIKIEVFNKGKDIINPKELKHPNVIVHNGCNNTGRESETYIRYILKEYNNLSDITIFTQGNPLEHAPNFALLTYKMLNEGLDSKFLPMSVYWRKDELPPPKVTNNNLDLYYVETASRYTLGPVKHWDDGIKGVYFAYLSEHEELQHGDDVIHHFCNMIGLPDEDYGTDFFNFVYSGIFATKKESIRKHDLNFYFNCYSFINKYEVYGFFFERIWMKMFS
jgi:hypothetical protein